jgi:hypothetical protein
MFCIILMCWSQKYFFKNKKNHFDAFQHEKHFEKYFDWYFYTNQSNYKSGQYIPKILVFSMNNYKYLLYKSTLKWEINYARENYIQTP